MSFIIDRPELNRQFLKDRARAIDYINNAARVCEGSYEPECFRWIKAELSYPSFDDFTFGYRNQIFSVLVFRANDRGDVLNATARINALRRESARNNLIPCMFPINDRTGEAFFGDLWNLINPFTGQRVYPDKMSSDEPVKMSDWELRNWAVQIVCDYLRKEGREVLSFSDAPGIDPQIWFRDKDGNVCWLEVLYAPYPTDTNSLTFTFSNWPDSVLESDGYSAKVGFMNSEDMNGQLYRTCGAFVNFRGIERVHTPQ